MNVTDPLEIFLVVAPGLEASLAEEARAAGLDVAGTVPGGVTLRGGWPEVWRANRDLRGATRVLARVAEFRAMHLAQLDKRLRKLDWAGLLRPEVPFRVEATTRKSRIYHAGAAAQRLARAITETLGAPEAQDAPVTLKLRIDDDLVTLSVDTSGESLHKRGHKQAMGKAPLRETLAALFLRQCGYAGDEAVLDPMCGSGTFPIEAAEIAAGLLPGRARSFAFEHLVPWSPGALAPPPAARDTPHRFHGRDRDAGAIRSAVANAERAGVAALCDFVMAPVSELTPPDCAPGLVIVNPPYGTRIGNPKLLYGLYGALGGRLRDGFAGWRVGLVTSEAGMARATGLPWQDPGPPVDHGGLKVRLWRTGPLPSGAVRG